MTIAPTPWRIQPGVYDTNPETACEFPHGPEIFAADGSSIASCNMFTEEESTLMAAAPFLLAALQKIAATENREFGSDCEEIEEARQIANDAIKLVTGER